MVPVSVTDAAGKPVENLKADDFKVEENNTPESVIRMVEPGLSALDLVLLFDISGSVNPRFAFELEAATHFLKRIFSEGDSISIVAISAEPVVVIRRAGYLQDAIESLGKLHPTQGMTAFFDSVSEAARLLSGTRPAPDNRRVVVALSDGEDNNSNGYQLTDTMQQIQQADCIFYAINPAGPSLRLNKISLQGQGVLQTLAAGTGGYVFLPDNVSDLETIFDRIATELRTQYLLEYYSSNSLPDGRFRRIQVTVPGRPDLRIRARQGYYPSLG